MDGRRALDVAALKPYFNDFVVHDGHAYGFDGRILACIDLKDGQRKWKGGRYGNGQMVLLRDQNVLLVLSEKASWRWFKPPPTSSRSWRAFLRCRARPWNHPALVGDVLLVRNGSEMVAFRLALAGR
jgi:hypothetical protein